MASSRYLITSTTLGSSAASVTFSSIPNTYTDLVLKWSTRASGNSYAVYVSFNGVTQFTYSNTRLYVPNSTTPASQRTSSDASIKTEFAGDVPSTATASTFSNGELYIPNYTSTSSKQFGTYTVSEQNASGVNIESVATLYTSANAITSLTVNEGGGVNFVSGSSFYLYGIKNS